MSGGGLRGYSGKIRRYLGRKQPKTCVWVSDVGREGNFAKVSVCSKISKQIQSETVRLLHAIPISTAAC
ncbi:hypothetical protein BWP02_01520 [Neisseria gonorrhoeae]|nr:hypothetical protein BWP02_01520 [Neisseria gonorrhoeae]